MINTIIIDDEMHLNDIGQAVRWIWNAMPERFPTIELDQYVIMPNHIHGIIILHPYEGAMNCAPTLGLILRTFKALATRYLHAAGASDFAWQRNFQVRGDLVQRDDGWVLVPRKVVGGFEAPPSRIGMLRANAAKAWRFRKTAKRELARRS